MTGKLRFEVNDNQGCFIFPETWFGSLLDELPLRTTPSVAEQEGQLIETEATGAPQKHHHTLNQ